MSKQTQKITSDSKRKRVDDPSSDDVLSSPQRSTRRVKFSPEYQPPLLKRQLYYSAPNDEGENNLSDKGENNLSDKGENNLSDKGENNLSGEGGINLSDEEENNLSGEGGINLSDEEENNLSDKENYDPKKPKKITPTTFVPKYKSQSSTHSSGDNDHSQSLHSGPLNEIILYKHSNVASPSAFQPNIEMPGGRYLPSKAVDPPSKAVHPPSKAVHPPIHVEGVEKFTTTLFQALCNRQQAARSPDAEQQPAPPLDAEQKGAHALDAPQEAAQSLDAEQQGVTNAKDDGFDIMRGQFTKLHLRHLEALQREIEGSEEVRKNLRVHAVTDRCKNEDWEWFERTFYSSYARHDASQDKFVKLSNNFLKCSRVIERDFDLFH
jgi:hypothetical protein